MLSMNFNSENLQPVRRLEKVREVKSFVRIETKEKFRLDSPKAYFTAGAATFAPNETHSNASSTFTGVYFSFPILNFNFTSVNFHFTRVDLNFAEAFCKFTSADLRFTFSVHLLLF